MDEKLAVVELDSAGAVPRWVAWDDVVWVLGDDQTQPTFEIENKLDGLPAKPTRL